MWGCSEITDGFDNSLQMFFLILKLRKLIRHQLQWINLRINYLNFESAWATESNKMVQFQTMWRKVIRALVMEVCASRSVWAGVM